MRPDWGDLAVFGTRSYPPCVSEHQRPLDVPIKYRELPADVVQARLEHAAEEARNEKVARPRVEALLAACRLVLQQLEELHRRYADLTDLDLVGYSRASAIWLLSGRQLGLLNALLVQAEAGIVTEAMITGRAIHEASRVLFAFGVAGEDKLVRLWLDDKGKYGYVKQGPARAAQERYEAALAEAMTSQGLPAIASSSSLTEDMYDRLSRVAHSRRSSCVNSVSEAGRQMVYGRHPSAIHRADCAVWAAGMTTEVTLYVGGALAALYSKPNFFTESILPLQKSIEAVRESAPLDGASIRAAAGSA
jgi:hypothetical protein